MSRRPVFRWRYFGIAALAALLLHGVVVPGMFRPLLERPARPVEIAFVDDTAPTAEIAAADRDAARPPPRPAAKPPRERVRPERPRPDERKPDEPPKLLEKRAPPAAPNEPQPVHQKMVDQDKFPDEADNAEARYLAQKNHRTARDTRALDTNLVRDARGPTESPVEKSESKAENLGMKERRIAELARRAGVPKAIVRSRARSGDEGNAKAGAPGKLSMRALVPRNLEQQGPAVAPRPGVELRDRAQGTLAAAREGTAGDVAGARARGARQPDLTLRATDYDKIVGESVAKAERERAARAEVSHAEGRWAKLQKKQEALRSSLENFTPDAYVGRESELGTRAHPYAAYIAEMHRTIHKLWAFSFLRSLDSRGALDPFNDMQRFTRIAIVLKESGEVESASIARLSGYLPFDTAAWDVVMQASPFPRPPEAIKSYDGKVYVDWVFHRDDRQCGTDFVVPHILTGDKHTHAPGPPAGALAAGPTGS